jgi:hypothetical protein
MPTMTNSDTRRINVRTQAVAHLEQLRERLSPPGQRELDAACLNHARKMLQNALRAADKRSVKDD